MARGAFAVGNYLWRTGAVITAPPFTLACWVYPLSAALGTLMSLGRNSSNNDCFLLRLEASGAVWGYTRATDAVAAAVGPANYTLGAWQHVAFVKAASDSAYIYRNGVAGAHETTDRVPVVIDNVALGVWKYSGVAYGADAYIADAGWWNAALSTAQIGALYGGAEPAMVQRGANLVAAHRCTPGTGGEADILGSYDLTEVGAVAHQAHPPIRRAKIATPAAFGFARRFAT